MVETQLQELAIVVQRLIPQVQVQQQRPVGSKNGGRPWKLT